MHLAIDAGENPERVLASWKCGCGIKRRSWLLLANAWDQRAGKEIARRGEEAGDAEIFRLQGPGIIAARTVQRQRRSIGAAANEAGQVGVEKMIFAQTDSSASFPRNWPV